MELIFPEKELYKNDVVLSHAYKGGPTQEILWNIGVFDRTELGNVANVFEHINAYWGRLPAEEQDTIFQLYYDIKSALDDAVDIESLTLTLQRLVRELLDQHHKLSDVESWMQFYSDIMIPSSIPVNMVFEQGSPTTAEKTYLKEDYRKLVVLAIVLHAMIPIWGQFINNTKKECGSVFKEYYAVRILNTSALMQSPAMEKLRAYIFHHLPAERSTDAAVISAISSEDYPNWMLASILVRRLCICDVRGTSASSTLVTFIHSYIKQRSGGQKTSGRIGSTASFSENIRNKFDKGTGGNDDDDNKSSRLESYKIQEEVTTGDVLILRHYLEDPFQVAFYLEPGLPRVLLEESLQSVQALTQSKIERSHITLMQWVLKRAISPRGLVMINKVGILNAMAITQAILWYRGHKDLAALVSAQSIPLTEEHQAGLESRARVPKELAMQLMQLFPFTKRQRGDRILNPALEAIDRFADEVSEKRWQLTLPEHWLSELDLRAATRRYTPPSTIKIKLANLICQLVTHGRVNNAG